MKDIVEHYRHKSIIFKSLKPIPVKELGSRKKIDVYIGVDLQGYYVVVIGVKKQSRILRKEAFELTGFHSKLEVHIDSKITKKYLCIKAPLCSKAKRLLEEDGWMVDAVQ